MKEALESPLPSNIIKEWVWIAMEIMGPRCFLAPWRHAASSRKAGLNGKKALGVNWMVIGYLEELSTEIHRLALKIEERRLKETQNTR